MFVRDKGQVLGPFANSSIIAPLSAVFAVSIGSLASYHLSRFRFKSRFLSSKDLAFWIISQRFFPPLAVVIPVLIMYRQLHLLDSHFGMILLYGAFNLPFAIWLLRDYFESVPREIEEAALVDGCSPFQAFFRVFLPLSAPGLITAFLFCLVLSWNEFLFALILTFQKAQTIPLLIAGQNTQRGPQWWDLSAMAIITILPALVITIVLQRRLVSGLTLGAIK